MMVFFDYNEKYSQSKTTIHSNARLDNEFIQQIKDTALKIYQVLECNGFVRIDMFIYNNEIYFNEVNTIPGLTKVSRFTMMLENNNLSFKKLLIQLIEITK